MIFILLGLQIIPQTRKKRWCSHLSMSLFPSVHLSVYPSFCPWCDLKNRIFFLIVSSLIRLARKLIERRRLITALTLEKLKINRILEVFSFRRCTLVIWIENLMVIIDIWFLWWSHRHFLKETRKKFKILTKSQKKKSFIVHRHFLKFLDMGISN